MKMASSWTFSLLKLTEVMSYIVPGISLYSRYDITSVNFNSENVHDIFSNKIYYNFPQEIPKIPNI